MADADISAVSIDWRSLGRIMEEKKDGDVQAKDKAEPFPIQGNLRLRADSFLYDKYTITGLQTDIALSPDQVTATVKKALFCNMPVTGTVLRAKKDLTIDLSTAARGLELEPAIACVTEKRADIHGTYDLEARINLRGKGAIDPRSLQGSLDFKAQEGRIYRFTILSKIFSLLNITEIFRGRFPDVLHEGFGYRRFTVKGNISGGILSLKEASIDAQSMEIVGEGKVDLIKNETDIKALVAPFRTIDSIIRIIPWWKESSLVSIPVKITGDLRDPDVSVSPVAAVGSGLLGMMEKMLMAPVKMLQPGSEK
jgi:hypothetical protein